MAVWTEKLAHAPDRVKWRRSADLGGQKPRETAASRERKIWQTGLLSSSPTVSDHGEMALCALEKASFPAVLCLRFRRFSPCFTGSLPLRGAMGRECDTEKNERASEARLDSANRVFDPTTRLSRRICNTTIN
jgi:hypothetical protein